MPIHDWTKVDTGIFHSFQLGWIMALQRALNQGGLPAGYYAMSEQHLGNRIPNVRAIQVLGDVGGSAVSDEGGASVLAPPKVGRRVPLVAPNSYRALRRTLAIRRRDGGQIVAVIEIVSPANKDRRLHVGQLIEKIKTALESGIHVLLIDLFPPGPADPSGLHGALSLSFDPGAEVEAPPPETPLTLVAYEAMPVLEANLVYTAVGQPLPDMPLVLRSDVEIGIPLSKTYTAAFGAMPAFLRDEMGAPRPTG